MAMSRLEASIAVVVAISLCFSSPLYAHAVLLSATPDVRQEIIGPDVPLDLRFNSRVDAKRSTLTLVGPDGNFQSLQIADNCPPDQLVGEARGLTTGSYILRWQVLAADGHITRGEPHLPGSGERGTVSGYLWLSVSAAAWPGLLLPVRSLTLVVGSSFFVAAVARQPSRSRAGKNTVLWLRCFSSALALTQVSVVAMNSVILASSSGLRLADIAGAAFWTAGALSLCGALGVVIFAGTRLFLIVSPFLFAAILAGSVMTSWHSVEASGSSMVSRGGHIAAPRVAGAAWIGERLPYLVMALRRTSALEAAAMTARFSKLAMVSVTVLIGAGMTLSFAYVGSFGGMVGATYGVMLTAKAVLTAILLLLGALNFKIVRAVAAGGTAGRTKDMLPLRRFAEAEIGIGFTILLAAASLTSAPPAVDVRSNRVPLSEIARRMEPRWPRMETPSIADLAPAKPLPISEKPLSGLAKPIATSQEGVLPVSFVPGQSVPGQSQNSNGPADIAWSEYNHHWAGLVVLSVGILAAMARKYSWARSWPLAFLGLAVFILVRADPENWPLGPRGFWESFQVAEVAQHRVFALLIVALAVFEWSVETRRIVSRWAALVFPSVSAAGGALLLTHSHSLANVREELLAEWSHMPMAILAVVAGWSRWLELRLPRNLSRIPAWDLAPLPGLYRLDPCSLS